jgi:hypothetical protein
MTGVLEQGFNISFQFARSYMRQLMFRMMFVVMFSGALVTTPAFSLGDESATTQPAATQPTAAGPTKFYGVVTAVDTTANTFSIGDQTYQITSESQMTKADKTATLADAVVGEPARGSYTADASGKMSVTKVRFGKKTGGKSGGKKGGKKGGATSQPSDAGGN